MTKADNSAGNSNNHSSACSTKALCILPILSFKITKKTKKGRDKVQNIWNVLFHEYQNESLLQ